MVTEKRNSLDWMAVVYLSLSVLGGLAVSALTIHVSKEVDVQAILLMRMAMGAVLSLVLMRHLRIPWIPDPYGMLARRSLFSTFASQATYLSIISLPLATSTSIMHTHPVWTALLGWFFIGSRIHRVAAGAICLCLLGTLLTSWDAWDVSVFGILSGLAGATLSSCSLLATQRTKAFSPFQLIAHASLVASALALSLLILRGQLVASVVKIATQSEVAIPILLGAGIGCMAQLAFVVASQRLDPVMSSTLRLLEIPLSLVLASYLYDKVHDFESFLGAGAILLGSAWLTVYSIPLAQSRMARRRANKPIGYEPTMDGMR